MMRIKFLSLLVLRALVWVNLYHLVIVPMNTFMERKVNDNKNTVVRSGKPP